MSNITWTQYGIFIAIATILYYIIIVFIFFKRKMPAFNTVGREKEYTDTANKGMVNNFVSVKEEDFIDKKIISREEYLAEDISFDLPDYLFEESSLQNSTEQRKKETEINTNHTLSNEITNEIDIEKTSPEIYPIVTAEKIKSPNSETETADALITPAATSKNTDTVDLPVVKNKPSKKINLKAEANVIAPEKTEAKTPKAKQTTVKEPAKDSILHLLQKPKKGNQ
jgi:hypothetical protein